MEINIKIDIANKVENVWKALTKDEYVSQYMFDSKIESSWQVGTALNYYIDKDGQQLNIVLGIIEEINQPFVLQHTLFPSSANYPNELSNHIYVRYTLNETTEGTSLQIEQGRFDTVEEGEKRYQSAKQGWEMILPQLKAIAEQIL